MGIGALNGVQLAVYGRKYINLRNEVIKILGTYFWYNKMIREESNFLKVVSNGQNVLKLWWLRNLTLEERIVVFKSLAISKIIFQALIATVPSHIKVLETIQREGGGLKNVDIWNKLTNLQILWKKKAIWRLLSWVENHSFIPATEDVRFFLWVSLKPFF